MKRSVPGSSPRRDPSLAGNRLQLTPSQQRLLERLEFMTSFDGPLIALCGLNGAGKTTVFNCVGGFYRPTSGSILMQDKNITGEPSHKVAQHGLGIGHVLNRRKRLPP